ncbi:3109_t:CDS:2 [Paraglomus brasilianum]|uniref:3109_t:CDS:1 n=1 Tax=Paraglomus brasilianum TaxID=144538 RepID=A0A9N9AKR9_9GLOM|nr:3109_t:CDS:2 [Paraglomus brasilianum]
MDKDSLLYHNIMNKPVDRHSITNTSTYYAKSKENSGIPIMSKTESDLKPVSGFIPRLRPYRTYYEGMLDETKYRGFSPEETISSLKASVAAGETESDLGSIYPHTPREGDLSKFNVRSQSELTVRSFYEDDLKTFSNGDEKTNHLTDPVENAIKDLSNDKPIDEARDEQVKSISGSPRLLNALCIWQDKLQPIIVCLRNRVHHHNWQYYERSRRHRILVIVVAAFILWMVWIAKSNAPTELLNRHSDDEIFSRAVVAAVTRRVVIKDDADMKGPHLRTVIRALVAAEIKSKFTDEAAQEFSEAYDSARTIDIKDDNVIGMIRSEASDIMKRKLATYDDDLVGKTDYALRPAGAKIIGPITSKTYVIYPETTGRRLIAQTLNFGTVRGKPPVTAIMPDTHVGQCWPFSGNQGQLGILLSRRIYPTAVTYDHISKQATTDASSAPKDFEVWGFIDDDGGNIQRDDQPESPSELVADTDAATIEDLQDPSIASITGGSKFELGSLPSHVPLGRFRYDINGRPVQTFELSESARRLKKPIKGILLKVNSNWDNPTFTCLYRFRVHGVNAEDENI